MSRASFRARRLLDVAAAYQALLDAGFPCEFEGVTEALQVATDTDRANWLIFLGVCDEAVAAGLGDDMIPIPIRCLSNRAYIVSVSDAQTLIRALRTWGLSAQANLWRLKDLVGSALTGEDLNAIDATQGWPGG